MTPGTDPAAGVPLVAVRDLVVNRGSKRVLEIDRLQVAEGETLSVVGPNGAGKSTLLLALARLIHRPEGRLEFRGAEVGRGGELAYRRRIGLVLPDPLLLDTSVSGNVASGLRFRGVPSREIAPRVAHWLERLGVAHLAGRPARQISSGEAQRVTLARAMVLEPDLLLLDEPFSSVDAATRLRLLDDLEGLLRETAIGCVVVTHDLDEAVRLGDRIAVVIRGRLHQCDRPEQVLRAPVDPDVAAFVGTETRLAGRVVESHDGIALVDVGEGRIEAASDAAPGRSVLCCLRPEDVTLWAPDGVGAAGRGPDDPRSTPSDPSGAAGLARPARFTGSARNQLHGTVSRLVPQGPLVRVSVDCGFPLVAAVTRASALEMGLVEGGPVVATFKASAVHLIPLPG
jgi:tungstate transport system ATP-binding protein